MLCDFAALRHDRPDAPWVLPGAINAELSATYVETQRAPTRSPGDVVVLDNLSSHKTPRAAQALRKVGARVLFLPPCRPDLNPIGMAFSKLKGLIRKAAARPCDDLWRAAGQVCDRFSPAECQNDLTAAGYEAG